LGKYEEYGNEHDRRQRLLTAGKNYKKQADDLTDELSKMQQKTLAQYNKEGSAVREEMDKLVAQNNQERDAAISKKNQEEDKLKVDEKKYKDNKNRAQAELSKTKNILSDLTQRDIEHSELLSQPNGKVLLADASADTVVIDIGSAQGVKNGYVFEVFALRPGEGKISKGYIKVRRANPSMSECFAIKRELALPKDTLSSYVASQPEEKFSPYQAGVDKEKKVSINVQPLEGKPKVVSGGPSAMDPIVQGDLIENPFFSPWKPRTYFIAGSKKIENERQKSAIRYAWPEIKAMIEFYGGKVSPEANTNVDIMIMQKSPDSPDTEASEQEEFKRAKFLGIPVLYEWELFRFLDNR